MDPWIPGLSIISLFPLYVFFSCFFLHKIPPSQYIQTEESSNFACTSNLLLYFPGVCNATIRLTKTAAKLGRMPKRGGEEVLSFANPREQGLRQKPKIKCLLKNLFFQRSCRTVLGTTKHVLKLVQGLLISDTVIQSQKSQ